MTKGAKHFDILDFGMLFDTELPYNAVVWGLPYVVFPAEEEIDTDF